MQFKVPQFLDIEDKLFGDFTFKQFIYMVGGGGLCFVMFKAWGFLIAAVPIIIVGGFAGILAFYRPNGKPFINMLEAWFRYSIQDKLYIWKKKQRKVSNIEKAEAEAEAHQNIINEAKLGKSKLRDLAWSLDVLDLENKKDIS